MHSESTEESQGEMMTRTIIRTYEDLIKIDSFEDRFEYLKLSGAVGEDTFGFDRWLNQIFYKSKEWKRVRDEVIVRDMGHDLAHEDYPIKGKVIIHHMNPIFLDDLVDRTEFLLDPNYLICTSHNTHNAIHFGDQNLLPKKPIERRSGDTKLW